MTTFATATPATGGVLLPVGIAEMNVESYRRRAAVERKRGPGRPPSRATINTSA